MNIDEFDWRMYGVTTITRDLPPAYPGGPSHKAGAPIYSAKMVQCGLNNISFGMPSTIKLSYNTALKACNDSFIAKNQVSFLHRGDEYMVPPGELPQLYTYFENYMATVIFSFISLEIFANFVIDTQIGKKTIRLQLERKPRNYNSTELQKENISTTTKIGKILPAILHIPPIEDSNPLLWNLFMKMKEIRNKLVHMKPIDVNRGASVDNDSIFAEIINSTPADYPHIALQIMQYYKDALSPPFWLEQMREQYNKQIQDKCRKRGPINE